MVPVCSPAGQIPKRPPHHTVRPTIRIQPTTISISRPRLSNYYTSIICMPSRGRDTTITTTATTKKTTTMGMSLLTDPHRHQNIRLSRTRCNIHGIILSINTSSKTSPNIKICTLHSCTTSSRLLASPPRPLLHRRPLYQDPQQHQTHTPLMRRTTTTTIVTPRRRPHLMSTSQAQIPT